MASPGLPKELTRGYAVSVGEALAKVIPLHTLTQAQLEEMDKNQEMAA
jgi:hypothetical protein